MSQAKANGVELYYEVHGAGEPLLLIQGLAASSQFWFRQLPELKGHFLTIIFDNRDVGRSDLADGPYTIADMAHDALALLDHLEIEAAHLAGVSMGGYIAQEMALSHPQRVKRLVLLCTHYGGPEYLELTGELWREILDVAGLSPKEIYRKGIRYSTTPRFFHQNMQMVERLVQMRLDDAQPPQAFQRQFGAASQFHSQDRLDRIEAPTLILAGKEDRVVPLELVERLAQAIPSSTLTVIEGAAHLLHVERPEEVNRAIIQFL